MFTGFAFVAIWMHQICDRPSFADLEGHFKAALADFEDQKIQAQVEMDTAQLCVLMLRVVLYVNTHIYVSSYPEQRLRKTTSGFAQGAMLWEAIKDTPEGTWTTPLISSCPSRLPDFTPPFLHFFSHLLLPADNVQARWNCATVCFLGDTSSSLAAIHQLLSRSHAQQNVQAEKMRSFEVAVTFATDHNDPRWRMGPAKQNFLQKVLHVANANLSLTEFSQPSSPDRTPRTSLAPSPTRPSSGILYLWQHWS